MKLDLQKQLGLSIKNNIKKEKKINFVFDNKKLVGYEGDTLASALLRNGIHLVGRSFKYHRPRGILSSGSEEPNALVTLGKKNDSEPNLKATEIELYEGLFAFSQNRFPSLKIDFASFFSFFSDLLPAGFYYKTFMWPKSFWMIYEKFIRRMAGLGKVTTIKHDSNRYEKKYSHVDILIVGGGPCGLIAALQTASSGQRVLLCEAENIFGGWLNSNEKIKIEGKSTNIWKKEILKEISEKNNITLLNRTTAFNYEDHNFVTLSEKVTTHLSVKNSHLPKMRLWKVRARQVILATGCIERPLIFEGNDLPGIMLSSAVLTYINRFSVLPGKSAVILTNNDDAYFTALRLKEVGCNIKSIIDLRHYVRGELVKLAIKEKIEILNGYTVIQASGINHINRIKVAKFDEITKEIITNPEYIDCDLLVTSGGLNPSVHLHSQARGKISWDNKLLCFKPTDSHEQEKSIGACNGTFDLQKGIKEAIYASKRAVQLNGGSVTLLNVPKIDVIKQSFQPKNMWELPTDVPENQRKKAFVDFQNDVTSFDLKLAKREGYTSIEHVKRYTTTGMATDQGKTSNVNAIGILSELFFTDIPSIGTTTFRMPYSPTSFGLIAGRNINRLFDPVRTTPLDAWHREKNARFEHVGQWMRAWYYPKQNESFTDAVNREVKAVRTNAGILDASTLGKIDIRGPDSSEFLNRLYTNRWDNLAIGHCRYGLMLKEDGMVFDDGVTTRLNHDHFHMSTTSGGASNVLGWMEELLQTEWPDLKVFLTSVTEQWSVITISGPSAKSILFESGCDIDLDDKNFPFMTFQEGHISGLPVRVFRISFTGEVSYEINVRSKFATSLWHKIYEAGNSYDLTPYGTEAMHVLRAEKGFIIVGQETDGTVTPIDLGLSWIVSKKKNDFIGKRALDRNSMHSQDRKQLVGLLTKDPKVVIPEGAHAVSDINQELPFEMLGHVTSSYFSKNLEHSIALALLKDGRSLIGNTVWFPQINASDPIEAKITNPMFL